VLDLGVKPVGQPHVTELTVEDGAPLHVKAVFEYIPDFSIAGYQSVTVGQSLPWRFGRGVPAGDRATPRVPRHPLSLRRRSSSCRRRLGADPYKGQIEDDAEVAPIAGEDSLGRIGGKDTVEAFSSALRGAKAARAESRGILYPSDYAEPKLAGKTVGLPEVEVKFHQEAYLARG